MSDDPRLSRRDFLKLSGLGALALALGRTRPAWARRHYLTVQRIDPRFGVLMTVDDGYSRTFVPMIEAFHRRRVPIAFFAVGRVLPILADFDGENKLEKLIEVGGIVCNHSYTHPYFTHLTEKEIAEQIEGWEAALERALGREYLREMKARFPYFRIPFGAGKNLPRVLRVLADYGYVVVWWNWDDMGTVLKFVDEAHLKEALQEPLFSQVVQAIVREATAVHRGDIVLMHSNDWSKDSLDGVLDVLTPLGWADPIESLAQAVAAAGGTPPGPEEPGILPRRRLPKPL